MFQIAQPIIVEGRYDKIRLSSLVQADIITTEGFRIFKDKQKLAMLRALAQKDKLIVMTDSDRAGFLIRGYISGAVPPDRLIHIYVPEILGKEPRKAAPSAAGTLGVEGMPDEILRRAFSRAGVIVGEEQSGSQRQTPQITKADLYRLGLSGGENSALLRRTLLKELGLPQALSANAMPGVLSRLITLEQLEETTNSIRYDTLNM